MVIVRPEQPGYIDTAINMWIKRAWRKTKPFR